MGCCMGRKKVLPAPAKQACFTRHTTGTPQKCRTIHGNCREVRVNTYVEQRYNIFSSIGKGEFGHVVRAENKHTKIPYAIKIIDLTKDVNEKAKSELELEILSKVKHDYVIQLHDVIKSTRKLYLVMDLATGGELMDRICLLGKFDEHDATRVLTMILEGLQYLHSLGITHRDLKPQNILYYHPGNDSKIIITDFGLSAMRDLASSATSYWMKTDCGTIEYMAPEVITRAPYTNAVDMWSMGVIVYIVLSGRLPFPLNGNIISTLRMICLCKYNFDGEPWNDISVEAKDFIGSLLVFDASKRLMASEALAHEWIKGKKHKKLNLQRSISSNWSNSCVSLKNEKGLKRHDRVKDTNLNPGKRHGKGKPVYTAVVKSIEKFHEGPHGKIRALEDFDVTMKDSLETTAERNDLANDVSGNCETIVKTHNKMVNVCVVDRSICTETVFLHPKHKHLLTTKADVCPNRKQSQGLDCQNTSVERKSSKQQMKVSPRSEIDGKQCENKNALLLCENTPTPEGDHGNLSGNFVRRVSSCSTREPRVQDIMSSQWNLVDLGNDESHVEERTPSSRAKSKRLPPTESTVTPLKS